jgi:hypothetical protein
MKKKLLALPLLAVSLLAFAGCSAPAAKTAPTPTAPIAEIATAEVACVDGLAVVTTDSTDVTIDGDCAIVQVDASNAQITVGAVETLEINGAINRVIVAEVGEVMFNASGNLVVTESDPVVTDDGEHNAVTDKNEM